MSEFSAATAAKGDGRDIVEYGAVKVAQHADNESDDEGEETHIPPAERYITITARNGHLSTDGSHIVWIYKLNLTGT
jgi:hypothetical protein